MPNEQLFSYIMGENVTFRSDDVDVHYVLDQHALLDFYSASSLKQLSVVRHVPTFGHIILIHTNQPVLAPECCMLKKYRFSFLAHLTQRVM